MMSDAPFDTVTCVRCGYIGKIPRYSWDSTFHRWCRRCHYEWLEEPKP